MQLPRWRNFLMLKNALFPALSQSITKTHFASLHSTTVTCEKWKSKWDDDGRGSEQPSKNYIRYATRQRRADAKRALQDLLYNTGSPKISFEDEEPIQSFDAEDSVGSQKKKFKYSARRAKKYQQDKRRRKLRRERFFEDFDDPERIFEPAFGKRCYTINNSFKSKPSGFEWREPPNWKYQWYGEWDTAGETKSNNQSYSVGSRSDRTILGLPSAGPLTIDDVKNAYRLSALKWHPDKHQGTAQASAEEKFKLCVDAYKSLCAALA